MDAEEKIFSCRYVAESNSGVDCHDGEQHQARCSIAIYHGIRDQMRDISRLHYESVMSVLPPIREVFLFLQGISRAVVVGCVMKRNRHTGCY